MQYHEKMIVMNLTNN